MHAQGNAGSRGKDGRNRFGKWMSRLRFWRSEQLSYYADVPRQSREYPPVVKD